jgi:hypothetical protein
MAQVAPISRHLQLQLQVGTLTDGSPKIANHNYAYVLPTASDDDVLAVGEALAGLFSEPLVQVARVDQAALTAATTTTA